MTTFKVGDCVRFKADWSRRGQVIGVRVVELVFGVVTEEVMVRWSAPSDDVVDSEMLERIGNSMENATPGYVPE